MRLFDNPRAFIEHLRRNAEFSDEGYPSEALLGEMLKVVGATDPTRPDYSLAYYRNSSDGTDSGLDAFSAEGDESAVEDEAADRAPTQLRLIYFISSDSGDASPVTTERIRRAIQEVGNFYIRCRLKTGIPEDIANVGSEALLDIAEILRSGRKDLNSVRIEIFTDLEIDPAATFEPQRTLDGRPVQVEIFNPERLLQSWNNQQQGKSDDIVLNLEWEGGAAHPVLAVGGTEEHQIYITALTGTQLAKFYGAYQLRAVNENVRAFLEFKGKTNKGIRETINLHPEDFMSYNNGLTIVSSKINSLELQECAHDDCDQQHSTFEESGAPTNALSFHDVQIVNGGQTTAAIYHCWKDGGMTDQVNRLRVFAKIVIVDSADEDERDQVVAAIAKYSNSQNKVDPATLESNIQFFKDLAAAADDTPVPSGPTNSSTYWYFDRAPGRYNAQSRAEGSPWMERHPSKQVIDKFEVAEVLNCVSGRPNEAQKGKSGSFVAYRKWIKQRNRIDARYKDQKPRGYAFFGSNQWNSGADYDNFEDEWRGTVASVIVLRRLKEIIDPVTTSWMRTISRRYLLAMAYDAFRSDWDMAWRLQGADEAYARYWGATWPSHDTFEAWAIEALRHVETAMKASLRLHPGKGENQRGQMAATWERAYRDFRKTKR
jgi:hypothetical protein